MKTLLFSGIEKYLNIRIMSLGVGTTSFFIANTAFYSCFLFSFLLLRRISVDPGVSNLLYN